MIDQTLDTERGRSEPGALVVEQRGIEHIPDEERYGTPAGLASMWSGVLFNVANVVYGALLVSIGLNFLQAVILILIANLSWFLVGLCSLPGVAAGTTTFGVNRAAFGVQGNKVVCVFNWAMQVGYEAVDLSLATLAGLALLEKAGIHTSDWLKVLLVLAGAGLQAILPLLGHRTILRVCRAMLAPFVIFSVILTVLVIQKLHVTNAHPGGWALWFVGLALIMSAGGLGWTMNASDFSRYLPRSTSKAKIVWAVAIGGAIPVIALNVLGAAVATVVTDASNPISGLPHAFASWFVVPYLFIIIVQLLTLNALNLYSSAVTIQAIGIKVTRFQAVVIDGVVSAGLTLAIVLSGSFNTLVSDFLLFMIVWFSPWVAIYLVDYVLRRGQYHIDSLLDPKASLYRRPAGMHPPGIIAQVLGMVASLMCIDTTVFVGPISRALNGADLSIPAGIVVGGLAYFVLARRRVREETAATSHPVIATATSHPPIAVPG